MPLFGEIFLSELLKKPVFDQNGEVIGRVKDIIVVKGDILPNISAIITKRRNTLNIIDWKDINIFNKRIISTFLPNDSIAIYNQKDDELLAVRDILDKQIVDINGVKIVRVNDIKIEGYEKDSALVAVDVGIRGILRRLKIEKGGEGLLKIFKTQIPYNLISWNYIQPLNPELKSITLTIPRQMLSELHPADIAYLVSNITRKEGTHLIENLDLETAADTLSELELDRQTDIINAIEHEKAADILEEMQPDEAADLLSDLPTEKAKEILEHIEKEESEDIQELLGHEEDTAGGIMTNIFISYPPNITVKEAIDRFKKDAEEIETAYYIYITDEQGRLKGIVSLRELLLADPLLLLSEIMETKVKTVLPDADEMTVAKIISKYNILAVPIVDSNGVLLGIATIENIIDLIIPHSAKRKLRRI